MKSMVLFRFDNGTFKFVSSLHSDKCQKTKCNSLKNYQCVNCYTNFKIYLFKMNVSTKIKERTIKIKAKLWISIKSCLSVLCVFVNKVIVHF